MQREHLLAVGRVALEYLTELTHRLRLAAQRASPGRAII
jgi:hypothetical protein